MKATNRLTLSFLREHPQDAAQLLEQLPLEMRMSLLAAVSPEDAAWLLEHLLPATAAACIQDMGTEQAAQLLSHTPARSAARILATIKQGGIVQPILNQLPNHLSQRIRQSLRHPAATVGTLMDRDYFVLPDNIAVSEALKRLKRSDRPISNEIYIIDADYRLVGMVELDSLFKAARHLLLRVIMGRHAPSVSVHARINRLLSRRDWQQVHSLAVVDTDGVVIGLLHHQTLLQNAAQLTQDNPSTDAFNSLLSIAGLYWVAVAELVDVIFSGRGRKSARPWQERP